MILRNRHVITLLFSFYFLCYILSPFCFTKTGPSDSAETGYQVNFSIRNIRIVWELFLPESDTQDGNEDASHNVQLLIKKARAVVSANSIVKFTPSASAECAVNETSFVAKTYTSLTPDANPECGTGFYLSVSGLSPPCLS